MSKKYHFKFVTSWELAGKHATAVRSLLLATPTWKEWWLGVKKVELIDDSAQKVKIKIGVFPYYLTFVATMSYVSDSVVMEAVKGDLIGKGVFIVEENDGNTQVSFVWNVVSTKKWINVIAPVGHIFFEKSHNLIMHWMAKGMAKTLSTDLLQFETSHE